FLIFSSLFKVHYQGVKEETEGDAFEKMKNFTLWVVDAAGNKTKLEASPKEDHYLASFTPEEKGVYTVMLDNDEIDVIDYSQYDFGIFKTHYHSVARIEVGSSTDPTVTDNPEGITIKNVSQEKSKAALQVMYKEESLPEAEVVVFVADQWSKTLQTDEKGMVQFDLPWDTEYVVEATKKEEVPGTYNDVPYEFVWHCATHYMTNYQ
ncbi:MAG: DUF4198 domain-containing protein, partial [Bacteroidota bacterium]